MAVPQVTFLEGQGGIGRALPSNDHISALIFFNASTLPSGFATTSTATRCKAFYSTDDAIAAGIVKDYSDATAAIGIYTVSNSGAAGDTIELKVADIATATGAAQTTSLGVYTRTSAATTVTLVAADIVTLINSGTSVHGYSATSSVGAINISAPKRLGAYLNGLTSLSATISGTLAGAVTQQFGTGSGGATAGVASKMVQYYYQISEFFRIYPSAKLWVGFFGSSTTYTEITDMQNNASGEIRQFGMFKDGTWAQADTTLLNTVANTNKALCQPCQIIYAGNLQATTDITTISDMSNLTNNNVQTCIGQDGAGWGNFIYKTNGTSGIKSITCLGAQLGMWSLRKVNENIGWREKSNISSGVELETPAFCNGQLVSALSASAISSLDGKRHVFPVKQTGVTGTFFINNHMCVAASSDYAYGDDNRVICKVERILQPVYALKLLSPLGLNANGTLSDNTVALFESIGNSALDQMIRDKELSNRKVTVNPAQLVLSTNKLIVSVQLLKGGTAQNIEIPIGFKPSIS